MAQISFTGKGSWFGGPNDSMDSGRTALGLTTATPGVAIRLPGRSWRDSRPYLGGYWRITAPNGRSVVIRQTDLGPNESTGRSVDVTYSALRKFGYNERNFPTDGKFRAEYLGKNAGAASSSSTPTSTPSGLDDATRRQTVAKWLLSKSTDPLALVGQLNNASRYAALNAPSGQAASSTRSPGARTPGGSDLASTATARANQINSWQKPYLWGGGHGGKVDLSKAQPLDCSGAVSAVLGIDPRVSGQFTKWGRPGRAPGGKGVTIYANATHVLMEINGHFFGTSKSNPGGGAGWIPRSAVPPEYLRNFTVRHSTR